MALQSLIAKKVGMTRMVDADGKMIPVTLLKVEEQKITKVMTKDKDGYDAVQVGYYNKTEKQLAASDIGRLRKKNIDANFARFTEFRVSNTEGLEVGHPLQVNALKDVPAIDVCGVTKGRGFTGAVSRWGTATGRMTHGSMYHRRPGSLGNRSTPGRVFKNKHGPGHYGCVNRTIQNLKIVDIDEANQLVAIKGSVPGFNEGFVTISPSVKLNNRTWSRKLNK